MSNSAYSVEGSMFADIRRQGKLYVDKTDMVYDLASRYHYVFLSRPPKFGKSLLCSTFEAYFKGQEELFAGLKIMNLEKDWKRYPVLHLNLGCLRFCKSAEEIHDALSSILAGFESKYGAHKKTDFINLRLSHLLHHIKGSSGQDVVVILDDYDAIIMENLHSRKFREEAKVILNDFYETLKTDGACIRFVFMTGIMKHTLTEFIGGFNNLHHISALDLYSGICGIKQSEMKTVISPEVEAFAKRKGIGIDDAYTLLRKEYGGYHFSEHGEEVYPPMAILNVLAGDDDMIGNSWFASVSASRLIELLKHYQDFSLRDFNGMELDLETVYSSCELSEYAYPLLYQAGFITITSYDEQLKVCTLDFPNGDVREGIRSYFADKRIENEDARIESIK